MKKNTLIAIKLMKVWGKLKGNIEVMAAENGLTLQQTFLLHRLYEEEKILMGALAKQLHCDASNVTGIVDRLESRGLIVRQDLPEDRRAKQLHITKQGREIIETMLQRLPEGVGFESLTKEESACMKSGLDKLLKN
jgi:DNA-binding MarR family transcriptional regulator